MDAVGTARATLKRARRLVGRAKRRLEGRSNRNPSRRQQPVIPATKPDGTSIVFLHHSTGWAIWNAGVPEWIDAYNTEHGTDFNAVARAFPHWPHPWVNDPFDYWRLWTQRRGDNTYLGQETIEQLAAAYDVIVWKHCFTAAKIDADTGAGRASSREKTLADFKVQYAALAEQMGRHADTEFLVWTVPPRAPGATNPQQAARATEFARWVRDEWQRPANVHIFDYHELAAPGGTLRADYPKSRGDSHPTRSFAEEVAPVFAQRIVDVAARAAV